MTNNTDLRIKVSGQINNILEKRANSLGITVAELVRHFIIKEIEEELKYQLVENEGLRLKNPL